MGLMTNRVKVEKHFRCLLIEGNNFVFDDLALSWPESTFLACLPGSGDCGNKTSQPNWQLGLANWAELGNKKTRLELLLLQLVTNVLLMYCFLSCHLCCTLFTAKFWNFQ